MRNKGFLSIFFVLVFNGLHTYIVVCTHIDLIKVIVGTLGNKFVEWKMLRITSLPILHDFPLQREQKA